MSLLTYYTKSVSLTSRKKLLITTLVFAGISYSDAKNLENAWHPLYQGIDYQLVMKPDGLKIHQIRIDPEAPQLEIFVTPPNENDSETTASKASTFLKKHNAQIVMNGAESYPSGLSQEGDYKTLASMAICNGIQYSRPLKENASFVVLKNRNIKILKEDELPNYIGQISMGLGACPIGHTRGLLIDDMEICPNLTSDQMSARSAIGITEDGKKLYFIVVEGRPGAATLFKTLFSEGISLLNLAQIMKDLGCYRAINLDGGGASTLVVENINNNKPLVLNTPSNHKGEEVLGSHIGLRAARLTNLEQRETFRALQENVSFFDLLQKSIPSLEAIYRDQATIHNLGAEKIASISELYQRFGIGQYADFKADYNFLIKEKGMTFENCFPQKYIFNCGNVNEFIDQLGINVEEDILQLSDLKQVEKKFTGIAAGGIYMDSNKVIYFVKASHVATEFIASRLMNEFMGTECTPVVKLLRDDLSKVASRMIRGFKMYGREGAVPSGLVGEVNLRVALDFICAIDRHGGNMGVVDKEASRVDFDYSFDCKNELVPPMVYNPNNDHMCLKYIHITMQKYPQQEVRNAITRITAVSDEQIFMIIFRAWATLSKIGYPYSLKNCFDLASKLIERKKAFQEILQLKEMTPKERHSRLRGFLH